MVKRCFYFTTDMFLKFKLKLERSYTDFIKKKVSYKKQKSAVDDGAL